jgi:hypothetical protein
MGWMAGDETLAESRVFSKNIQLFLGGKAARA